MGILSESMREKINERELKASGSTQKENSLSRSMREKINERELKASGSTQKENSLSRSILNEDDSLFDIAITEGAKRNSAQSTEIINLKNSTGLPEDVVERNFNEVTQKNRQKQIDTKKFSQSNPEVSRWMAQSPNHAAAGYEDLTGLSYLERQIKNIRNQFTQGSRTVELAEIGQAAMFGKATQQQRKRQNKIEEEQAQASDYDITGTIEEIPGAIAQQLPIIASTIKGQIKGAGAGAIAGAGVGSVVPAIGTIAGGVTGASFGWRYGAGVQAARQEAGLAYLEYEKIIDSKGRKIDRDVAVGSSLIVGVINGVFEMVGFELIIKTVPGLRALGRKQVKEVLKSQSVNSTLYNYAKNVGLAIGAEGATEFIQEIVTITGKEAVKAIKENRKITTEDFLSRIFSDDNISQALQAARAGAQAGGGIALGAGAVSSTIDYRKAKAAKVKAQNIEKTGQTVESLKLHKTSPKSVEQIVDNIAESKDVYIPSDTFQTYWQEKGIDPKQVISEVLGNTDQFDNAVETGQDIVIPAAKYYTSPLLGAGENKSFFAQEVRTDPLEMNAREWQDEIKRLDEEAVKIDESSAIGKDFLQVEEAPKIREAMKTKLTKAGYDNRTADSNAQLYESTFQNLGDLAGIDPVQLFERFNPEISRLDKEQTKTFLDRIKEGAQNLFQTKDQFPDVSKKVAISTGLTETPEFKNWFGDSKVVDEQGKPLVVYHGTNSDFEGFDLSKSKMASKANPSDLGFWFVDDSTYASYHGNNVLETYVSLKNPKIYSSEQWNSINKKQDFKAIRESLIKQGHDGVITEESFDTLVKFNVRNPRLVVAFNPEQIKSVNNRGTFDANDPRILFQDEVKKGAFRFGDGTFNIYLLEKADLSTFLHETGHFFLEMVGELAESSQASSEIKSYYKDVLEYLGVESRDQIATEHHEKFARGFEAYLMYGKAPSTALRRVFARFKVWLTNIYGTLKSLEVELTDDVRSVFDRLVASDKQIQEVEGEINISPLFEDTTILGNSAEKYKQAIEDFRMEVAERATSKMMKEYQREHKQWYKDELNNQREIVKQEMFADRAYIALTALQKGELPDGTPYSPETIPPKLSRKEVESIIGEERTKNLPRGIFAKDGAHPAILADLFQFRSDVALLEALESVEKPKDRIERVSKERMKELFPNLEDQQNKFREEILKDIHNEKRSEILRFELKWLAEEAPTILKDAIRKVSRRVPSNTDVKAYAKSVIDKSRVSKIEPNFYLRAEKAAARNAGISLAKGDLDEAFEQKRIELLNHELYKQAVEAKEQIRYSLDNFKKIAIADKKLSKTRDGDLVNAARAVLAGYGIGYKDERPETFLENMRLYAPETYSGIYPLVQSVLKNGADYRSISFSDFTDLNNVVQALWELSRSQKQIEIDGQKIERDEVIEQLNNRIFEISKPKERVGYNKAVTKWEKTKMEILGIRASLRRVESWVDAMDGGNPSGVFRKYIWNPISEATTKYRVQKKEYIQKYLDILKKIENNLTWEKIQSPELNYEFSDKAELLGAMLHIGNSSNLEKLLRGRGWGEFNENGVLDRSRWDVFVKRMQDTGVLNKSDYDYLQSVWDLFEELKPFAQKAHKAMYGYYFNEVTADSFDTPFGEYRGGYVPASIDPLVSNDQEIRQEREQLEGLNNSYMFPTTGRGFTQSRVERYAAPLQMNIRFIAGHIDKVLRFVNIEPHVKDVGKIVMNRSFRSSLNEFDSSIAGDMLVPWLQRTAKQQVETPSASRGGRAVDRFFRGVRKRTALNIMVGNVVNTIQQFTGLSMAMVKVPPKYMRNALWQYVKSPEELSDIVNEKSAFMNTRMATSVIEIQNTIDDLIINQNKYEKARDFALQHGYFMQAGTQNIVDIITWVGRYNQMVESGADEQLAVREADSCVRQTQGSFNAEDISRFESGLPFIRAFTMFYSYFNMQANLLGTEFQKIIRDIGLKKGAGRLLYVYVFGFMIPAVLSEMIVRAMSGKYDEDDDDIYLDDTLNAFFGAQSRSATAMFPVIGPITQLGINTFNEKWYDDRISTSPAVSMIESAAKAPHSVYAAISEDKSKKAAVRDTLSAIGLITGFPVVPIARPIGYMIDIDEGKAEPTGLIDLSRGLITGKSGN